jgi:hypothetical protein
MKEPLTLTPVSFPSLLGLLLSLSAFCTGPRYSYNSLLILTSLIIIIASTVSLLTYYYTTFLALLWWDS